MSPGLDGWVEEVCGDLHQDRTGPRLGPFGLLLLFLVLLALALAARGPGADFLIHQEEVEAMDPGETLGQQIQAALLEKSAGRYREAWLALRELHDRNPREVRINLELANYHWELTQNEKFDNHDFGLEYLRLVEENGGGGPRAKILRSQLLLHRAELMHQAATKVEIARSVALKRLQEALSEWELARDALPPSVQDGQPTPIPPDLLGELTYEGQLIRYKIARKTAEGGLESHKLEARHILQEIREEEGLSPLLEKQILTALENLKEKPAEWRSGQ